MSILIVEDNPVSARILEIILQKHGYQTIIASTGRQALECLKNTTTIRLVITDINMPEMDGLELLRTIKESPYWKEIPTIMLTALSDIEVVKEAIALGCRHYIIKPIKELSLLQKVHETLESEIPVIQNKFLLISELGLDLAEYEKLVQSFAAQLSEKISQLKKKTPEDRESETMFREMLDLSESAVVIGAERIKNILNRLSAKERSDPETMRKYYSLLLAELEMLQDALLSSAQGVKHSSAVSEKDSIKEFPERQ